MATRYDSITIKAELSKDGWIIDRPVITRSGIFTYHDSKGKVVKEYRPDDEVFKQDSLNTLRGVPITDGHNGILNSGSSLDGLIVGSVMSPGEKADSNVVADIVIHNVKRIGARRELSLGYECRIDEIKGEFNGQKYDVVQRDITYNHLAVVHKGRAGNARIRLDADDASSFPLEEEMTDPVLPKIRLDSGLEYPAAPEVGVYINTLNDKITSLVKRADKAEAERDTAKAELETAGKDHKIALDKERDAVRGRIKLEEKAKQLTIKFDGVSDRDLKQSIVEKLGNKLDFKDRSDDYVDSAYDMAVANDEQRSKTAAGQKGKTTEKNDSSNVGGGVSSLDARAKMIARIRGEKQEAA